VASETMRRSADPVSASGTMAVSDRHALVTDRPDWLLRGDELGENVLGVLESF